MQKRYYTAQEIADYLSFSIGAIRKYIRNGTIPFVRINGGIRFDIEQIDRWIAKGQRNHVYK